MSTKSKTGAKLVDSIRKSKTGTVASKTSERPGGRETDAKSRASSSRSSTKTTAKQSDKSLYSHGRRVWPD